MSILALERKQKRKFLIKEREKAKKERKFPIKEWEKAKKGKKIPDQGSEENKKKHPERSLSPLLTIKALISETEKGYEANQKQSKYITVFFNT